MENKETTVWKEIEALCKDCPAWSGTDCTRNPYTDGCLKDNKADQILNLNGKFTF